MAKFPFNPQASSIVLRGVVEGKVNRTVTLVLDTGASFTQLPWRVLQAIGYDPAASSKRTKVVTGSSVEVLPRIEVKRLRALGEEVEALEILCHDLPSEAKVDGLLGLNFLRNFNLTIKFKEGVIEID